MPNFNLKNDLVFFDLEATGLNVVRDRIVQIAMIKFSPGKAEPEEMEMLINPGIPISEEAMAIHGITPDMVRNKPTFEQASESIYKFIGNADLAGYNSDRFDIPMLMEEFYRAGFDFDIDKRNLIDVQKIFYKMEPRTLKAAYMHYCGKSLEDAHNALADVRATVDVLAGQLEMYKDTDHVDGDGFTTPKPIQNDMPAIAKFLSDGSMLDVTQKLRMSPNGDIVFNFGKYIGKPAAKTLYEDRQYYHWIQEKEFSAQVKKLTKKLLEDYSKSVTK
ncbi:MAG TPA: 3'-5' exonuclease [Saprospiraceae bacterium]|nr:3'-5' exonuclease [Saprospiraceae bacterium]